MDLRTQPSQKSSPQRTAHPVLRELVGNVDLNNGALVGRDDVSVTATLVQMLSNAEYWLNFDMAAFEPLLAKCPSPLRELGVAVALRFGDVIDGSLALGDLGRARDAILTTMPADLNAGLQAGFDTLERAVRARDAGTELEERGFRRYAPTQSLSVNALRAMGRSNIVVVGHPDDEKRLHVALGSELVLSATDERGRPLPPPEVESNLDAPLWAKDDAAQRTVVLMVPGEYWIRVPGRASGDRKLYAS